MSRRATTEHAPAWREAVQRQDGFHPDAAGYALLAEAVTPSILTWLVTPVEP